MATKEAMFFFLATFTLANAEFKGSAMKMFVTEMSGKFNNQYNMMLLKQSGYDMNQDLINVFVYPVKNNPALDAEYILYLEEWIGDQLNRQLVLGLTGKGNFIEIEPYDFVHPESYVPKTFNISNLESLTLNDLEFKEECRVYIQRNEETSFVGNWPDCTGNSMQSYTFTLGCNSLAFLADDEDFPESKSQMPYDLVKMQSLPVPASTMEDYEMYKSYC